MQREIKFRAWDGSKIIYPDSDGWFNNCKFPNEPKLQMCKLDMALRNLRVMQYTGLKDKNGKEIYEGDIVRHEYNKGQSDVFFDLGRFQPFSYLGSYMGSEYEVIGNIYENPELLEVSNDL